MIAAIKLSIAIGTEPDSAQSSSTGFILQAVGTSVYTSVMSWLDSPGAGTHQYKIQWQAEVGSTGYMNRTGTDGNSNVLSSLPSTLTVQEISV